MALQSSNQKHQCTPIIITSSNQQLRHIWRSLDDNSIATLVHAFIANCIDYCVGSLPAPQLLQGPHHCRRDRCLPGLWSGTTLRWTFVPVPCTPNPTDNSRSMGQSRRNGWFSQARRQLTKKRSCGLQQQQWQRRQYSWLGDITTHNTDYFIQQLYGDKCSEAASPKLWNTFPQTTLTVWAAAKDTFCSGDEIVAHCD